MSDVRTGWTDLLLAPLGSEPPVDTPLAVLPCVQAPQGVWGPFLASRSAPAEW